MKVYQCWCGKNIPAHIKKCMATVKKYYPDVEVVTLPESETPILDSDIWRIGMATKTPDMLYIDCDIELSEPLSFPESDKPYFNGNTEADYSLFYVNGHPEFFEQMIAIANRRSISQDTYGWPKKCLRDMDVYVISDGFTHLYDSYSKIKRGELTVPKRKPITAHIKQLNDGGNDGQADTGSTDTECSTGAETGIDQ
jgi:hypothetical protein